MGAARLSGLTLALPGTPLLLLGPLVTMLGKCTLPLSPMYTTPQGMVPMTPRLLRKRMSTTLLATAHPQQLLTCTTPLGIGAEEIAVASALVKRHVLHLLSSR